MNPHRKNTRFTRPLCWPYQDCPPVAAGQSVFGQSVFGQSVFGQQVFVDGTLIADGTPSVDSPLAMAAHAIPNAEVSNIETQMLEIEMFGPLAAGAFGPRGWRTMTERGHGGSGRFSDMILSVEGLSVEGLSGDGTSRNHASNVVGHVKSAISAAADTDPGG
jgi:hypothetical protein